MAGFIHDMALMEDLLMESKLCYTVVRPPGLSNGELNYSLEYVVLKVKPVLNLATQQDEASLQCP